jgi:hypothetical protein
MGKPQAKFTSERRRKVEARLKDYPASRLVKAVHGCKASSYHQGQNESGTKYDDLELICRDGKHVEMFESMCAPSEDAPVWRARGFASEAEYEAAVEQMRRNA